MAPYFLRERSPTGGLGALRLLSAEPRSGFGCRCIQRCQNSGAVSDFVSSAAALREESLPLTLNSRGVVVPLAGGADLLVYVGHEGLMDFQIARVTGKPNTRKSQFIILACASKPYFRSYMQETQSEPLLWTAGLMAPEAYTLQAALEGWVRSESGESIRQRAAVAYDKYQKCGLRAAQRLFVTGW